MTSTRATAAAICAVLLVGLLAVPAAAHVTADPDAVDSPSFTIAFRVGHGCAGSPTTAVRVQVPDSVEDAGPEEVPGWELQVVREGGGTTGAVAEVVWVRRSPDAEVPGFGLSGRFTEAADDVVYFPLVQECVEGEHRWIDVPATLDQWGDLEEPAPFVRLAYRDGVEEPPPSSAADADSHAAEEAAADPTGEVAADPTEEAEEPREVEQEPPAGDDAGADGGWPAAALAAAGALGVLAAGGLALARTRRG